LNPGRRGGKPATNRLSYGGAWVSEILNRKDKNFRVMFAVSTIGKGKYNKKCGTKHFSAYYFKYFTFPLRSSGTTEREF
jgi:hypothetical protein